MRVKIEYGHGLLPNEAAQLFESLGLQKSTTTYQPGYPVYGEVDEATLRRLQLIAEIKTVSTVLDNHQPAPHEKPEDYDLVFGNG